MNHISVIRVKQKLLEIVYKKLSPAEMERELHLWFSKHVLVFGQDYSQSIEELKYLKNADYQKHVDKKISYTLAESMLKNEGISVEDVTGSLDEVRWIGRRTRYTVHVLIDPDWEVK